MTTLDGLEPGRELEPELEFELEPELELELGPGLELEPEPVSYTHLTLPTIYSV